MTRRQHIATVGLFVVLAAGHTWPLALAPASLSRTDNGDYSLNAWTLAWVVHQAPRDPLHLFDANIFYPEPRTLAFSEHLVPQALLAAPVRWSGGSAVLACNVVLIAGLALSGWAMALVITRWTGDWGAGLVAGSLHAFNAHLLTRLVHLQALHIYYLPLALLALDLVLTRRLWRDAVTLGVAAAMQALTSGYWVAFTAVSLSAAGVGRIREWWDRALPRPEWHRQPAVRLTAAAALATILMAPFLFPYWEARQEQGLSRTPGEVATFSGSWIDYVTTGSRLHLLTPLRWGYASGGAKDALFPGVLGTLLTLAALASGVAWRDRRARMFLALGLAGLVLSHGMHVPGYSVLYDRVPLLQGIRAPSRFGGLVLVAVAGLAGFALASLLTRARPRARAVCTITALVMVNAEALRAPLWYKPYDRPSEVYRVLARMPDGAVAEFPMYRPGAFYRNADYMLDSTLHWKPLVNGYSGFMPARYRELAEAMRRFPDPPTVDVLRQTGVSYVVIHRNRFGAGRDLLLTAMRQSGAFELVAGDEQVRLFRLLPR